MNKPKAIAGVLAIFVTVPIWFYLLHTILTAINTGPVAWLLFWVYVPVGIILHICTAIAGAQD